MLGLDLRLIEGELRFVEPQTGKKLLSYEELEQARQQAEREREAESQARRTAIARLMDMGLSAKQVAEAWNFPLDEVERYTDS